MHIDPQLKNILCFMGQMHDDKFDSYPVAPSKQAIETFCTETETDARPTVVWGVDYHKIPEVELIAFTVKEPDQFV